MQLSLSYLGLKKRTRIVASTETRLRVPSEPPKGTPTFRERGHRTLLGSERTSWADRTSNMSQAKPQTRLHIPSHTNEHEDMKR